MGVAFEIGARAVDRCERLRRPPFSETCEGLCRRFLTPAYRATLDQTAIWMREAGMAVRIDGAANLIGRYEAESPGRPALMFGSHLDSVRNGGAFDGALGVMLAIDCVEALSLTGRRLPFAIEIIAFGDEEGSRFPVSMVCSRAVAGAFDPATLARLDAQGVSMASAFADFGLDPDAIGQAARRPGDILGFIEAHIEQGPALEAAGEAVGLVTAIAAQRRLRLRWTGRAGHAGTTPMHLRRDPLAAAAQAMTALERHCRADPDGLVGTVGQIAVEPGAFNVIPGQASFSMDVRAQTDSACDGAVDSLLADFKNIADARGLGLEVEPIQSLAASPCDPRLSALLQRAIERETGACLELHSGAGHDAMVMASLCPTAMLFIRCRGGLSHNPDEHVEREDAAVAARVLLALLDAYDGAPAS
jgi:allantoate deiminase